MIPNQEMSYVLTKLLMEYENNKCHTWREIVKKYSHYISFTWMLNGKSLMNGQRYISDISSISYIQFMCVQRTIAYISVYFLKNYTRKYRKGKRETKLTGVLSLSFKGY